MYGHHFVLLAQLQPAYPSLLPPEVQLLAPNLPEDVLGWAASQLQQLFIPGEVCLYEWIEWLRGQEVLWPDPTTDTGQQEHSETSGSHDAETNSIKDTDVHDPFVHGEPFVEKKSTFQGHVTPVQSLHEVEACMELLLINNKVQKATHNIMAYRIHNENTGSFAQDCDDDGEDAAGRRLLHLLQMVDARNVLVVVSRWFGGVLLGPARFTHINNAARTLLQECGYISTQKAASKAKSKGRA